MALRRILLVGALPLLAACEAKVGKEAAEAKGGPTAASPGRTS